jgi:hypothetical protein
MMPSAGSGSSGKHEQPYNLPNVFIVNSIHMHVVVHTYSMTFVIFRHTFNSSIQCICTRVFVIVV